METKELAKELLASIELEITLWGSGCNQIDNGYDYESQFIERARNISRILLEQSVAMKGSGRNKKSPLSLMIFCHNTLKKLHLLIEPTHAK